MRSELEARENKGLKNQGEWKRRRLKIEMRLFKKEKMG